MLRPQDDVALLFQVGLAVFKNLQYLDFTWFPSRAMGALKFGLGPSVKSSKHLPENLDKSK